MIIAKILNLLFLVIPLIVEWFKRERSEEEKAVEYVRRTQKEKLEVVEAILAQDGEKLTRLSRSRLLVTRELLRRVQHVSQPPGGGKDLLPPRAELPGGSTGGPSNVPDA